MRQSPDTALVGKPNILMIDDDVDFLHILSHLMEAMGHDLTTCTSAERGLDIARKILPDLIFCDLRLLGGMNGYEFARRIRMDDVLHSIPMIAVSGSSGDMIKELAVESGFNDIFLKPVKFAGIRAAVEKYVLTTQ